MSPTILSVMTKHSKNLKIDRALVDRLHKYEREFVNRNQDHIDFFSGYLLGVHRVKFLPSDWDNFFDNIVNIDDIELRREIIQVEAINPNWKVTSDVLNITCMYLVHRFYNSSLPNSQKIQGMTDALLIFYYKVITSKLSNDFKHLANKDSAEAVYAQLSKKFGLKKYGSWNALLRARIADLINPKSIHIKTIKTFTPDKKVMYLISDSQGRIKEVMKLQRDGLTEVRNNDKKIVSSTSTIEIDGETLIKDLNRNIYSYRSYLISTLGNRNSFIKDDLIKVVSSAMPTMSPILLKESLAYISDQYISKDSETIEQCMNDIIVHAFDVLNREYKGHMRTIDLVFIITKIRGVYTSSKNTDAMLQNIKDTIDKLVIKAVARKTPAMIAAVRTGVMLYCVIRSLVSKTY